MNPIHVTNHLLWLGFKHHADDITPLKTIKLLYFLHGWHGAITGEPLIDGGFIKGPYGPDLPQIKEALRAYGSGPVNDYIHELDPASLRMTPLFVNHEAKPQFLPILTRVWNQYRPLSTAQLSTLSHEPGSPWDRTPDGGIIRDTLIFDDFRAQAQRSRPAPAP